MYSFKDKSIVFMDAYEESIIDTKFLDYAMVLQSSRSHYELYNSALFSYREHARYEIYKHKTGARTLEYFNQLFEST